MRIFVAGTSKTEKTAGAEMSFFFLSHRRNHKNRNKFAKSVFSGIPTKTIKINIIQV